MELTYLSIYHCYSVCLGLGLSGQITLCPQSNKVANRLSHGGQGLCGLGCVCLREGGGH